MDFYYFHLAFPPGVMSPTGDLSNVTLRNNRSDQASKTYPDENQWGIEKKYFPKSPEGLLKKGKLLDLFII